MRTVEHLLSALEGVGVDNCRIELDGGDEVPLLDGSAKEWVENIEQVGLCAAEDCTGNSWERMAPILHKPIYVRRNDAFIVAVPSSQVHITYGIDFPEVPDILCQWFSCVMDDSTYIKDIASARTFCIFEEIEKLRGASLIQGGSKENAIICSVTAGWLNPPLRFDNEPCRHKVLDLIGDVSLFAQKGNQGIPLAQIIAYKAGHSLHAEFVRRLRISTDPTFTWN